MKKVFLIVLFLVVGMLTTYNFVCDESNPFFNLVKQKYSRRYDLIDSALKEITDGSALLIMSDDYPNKVTNITPSQYESMYEKNITVFVEFPSTFPGLDLQPPTLSNQYFRSVVNKYPSLVYLKPETILKFQQKYVVGLKNCEELDCIGKSILVNGKIAGYDIIPFGFPPSSKLQSIILHQEENQRLKTPNSLISFTSVLSNYYKGRYSPINEIRNMFLEILNFLEPIQNDDDYIIPTKLNATVFPMYSKYDSLPPQANIRALQNAMNYLTEPEILIHPPNPKTKDLCVDKPPSDSKSTSYNDNSNNTCMLSGFETSIDVDGNQPICNVVRIDCVAESSMALALGGIVLSNSNYTLYARNLLDYIYINSQAQRKSPESKSYGLISWGMPSNAWYKYFYGDDNARSLISSILASSILKTSKYDESLLQGILGNLRTSSYVTGFRPHVVSEVALDVTGWKVYFDDVIPALTSTPHYDSYLWALFLWAYEKTKGKTLLHVAERGIRTTMEMYLKNGSFVGHWKWTETMTEEQSRMLLPLAWLVRIDPKNNEYRSWLDRIAHDLLSSQEKDCGAIREVLGEAGDCIACPSKSNEDYGTHESPIIQENGDPASDLLYTSPFAFLGLLEAYYATNDTLFSDALSRLEDFLIRVQVRSGKIGYLNGGWLRAFDFEKWEFWGSSGDIGWGAWSQTTGWTETWISSVIALKHMETSLWDVSVKQSKIDRSLYESLCHTFFTGLYSKIFCGVE